jgi:cytochrome c-type biogenesis protein CcmF
MGLGVAVLYGTLYPFFSELLTKRKVVVQPAFFNRVSIPVGLALLALLGICQLVAWRKASMENLRRRFLLPLQLTLIGLVVLSVLGMRHIPALLTCGLGGFIVITIGVDLWRTLVRRRRSSSESFWKIIIAQRPRYAGYLFHLGVVLMFVGIAVSATYQLEQEVQLRPSESFTLGDIEFQYKQLDVRRSEQRSVVFAEVSAHKNGKKIATVSPQKRFYGEPPDWQITTEIGLYTSLTFDIYVILQGWQEDQTAVFTFIINPWILWIWIGGFLMFTVAILLEMFPASRIKPDPAQVKDTSQVTAHD